MLEAGRSEDARETAVRAEVPVGAVPGRLRTRLHRVPGLHLSSVQLQVQIILKTSLSEEPLLFLTLKVVVEPKLYNIQVRYS